MDLMEFDKSVKPDVMVTSIKSFGKMIMIGENEIDQWEADILERSRRSFYRYQVSFRFVLVKSKHSFPEME